MKIALFIATLVVIFNIKAAVVDSSSFIGKSKEGKTFALREYINACFKAGVKDIILPGEIRDIMNTVLIAEKKAQANVITRREETASTRSLLNTAKLMEENEILYRLKELEMMERIFEKVGSVNVNGSNVLESLELLIGKKKTN